MSSKDGLGCIETKRAILYTDESPKNLQDAVDNAIKALKTAISNSQCSESVIQNIIFDLTMAREEEPPRFDGDLTEADSHYEVTIIKVQGKMTNEYSMLGQQEGI